MVYIFKTAPIPNIRGTFMVVLAIGLLCIILADSLSNAAEVLLALLAAVALFVALTLMVSSQ